MRYNLSEITDLIKNRRTIYPEQFSDRKVHKEQIELLLNNAQWAPTNGNTQPWRFKVFTDAGLQKLSDFLGKTYLELTPKEDQNDMKLAKMITRPLTSKGRENIRNRGNRSCCLCYSKFTFIMYCLWSRRLLGNAKINLFNANE